MEKKKITIEVEPATAVATVGLLRGIFPSIIEQLERQAATNGSPLKFNKVENMQEVLDEIYEKCIAETNLREFAQAHLNSDRLPKWYRITHLSCGMTKHLPLSPTKHSVICHIIPKKNVSKFAKS